MGSAVASKSRLMAKSSRSGVDAETKRSADDVYAKGALDEVFLCGGSVRRSAQITLTENGTSVHKTAAAGLDAAIQLPRSPAIPTAIIPVALRRPRIF